MLDPFAEQAITNIFMEVFKTAFEGVVSSRHWLKLKGRELDLLGNAAKKYAEKFEDRHNLIRIMGMEKPVPLRNIYVRVNILKKRTTSQTITIENLEKEFDYDRRGFGTKLTTWAGIEIINKRSFRVTADALKKLDKKASEDILKKLTTIEYEIYRGEERFINVLRKKLDEEKLVQYKSEILEHCENTPHYIILGKPGAGKTTFLKFLALKTLDASTEKKRIPIFISLKDLSDSGKSLDDFIIEQFEICQLPDPEPFITRLLEKGKCLVLLDGLDEVSQDQEKNIARQILNFSDKYSNNQFIISCRTAAYNYWFPKFNDLEIADFDEEQIKTFVKNWFWREPGTAKLCWKTIDENKQIKELGSIPLLLTLLCITFNETVGFPQNRAELYKEAIDALLKKWDASRRIKREEIYKYLSVKRKEDMFSKIAAQTFTKGQYFLSKGILARQIQDFIQHLPESKEATLEPDSEAILEAIEWQHGIFVQRAHNIYSFSHLTFQEYFTAKHFVDNSNKGSLDELVIKHIKDEKWREVFLLTTAMLHEADDFLLLMNKRIQGFLKGANLINFIDKIQGLTKKERSFPTEFNRALAMNYIFRHAYAVIDEYASNFRKADHDIVRICEVGANYSLQLAIKVAHSLHLDDLDGHNIMELSNKLATQVGLVEKIACDPDFGLTTLITTAGRKADKRRSLRKTHEFYIEFKGRELSAYLRANNLLLDCMNAECYLSKPVRNQILNSLLSSR